MLRFIARLFGSRHRSRDVVTFDGRAVTRTSPEGPVESVRWDDLLRVEVWTTSDGPFFDDVYWMLAAEDHGCIVPSESDGMVQLLARLQELPGFDHEAVIRAMGSTGDAHFLVWSREREPR